ncbi:MAG: DUF5329 family protein [Planctomycetota bacterium]
MNVTLLVAALLLLAPSSAAQAGIRLAKVPEVVRLPAAAGSNLLLEVEIDGSPTEVWLATDATSRDRVPLTNAGATRWQLNLADARVAAMVPGGRDGGTLTVFAAIAGTTKQSTAIAWSRTTTDDGKALCLVRRSDGTTRTAGIGSFLWLDLARTEHLELYGAAARQSAVVARGDDHAVPLVRRPDAGTWVLTIDAGLRERLRDVEVLEVEARMGAENVVFRFGLVPGKLVLDGGRAEFVVQQRRRAQVPGSRGWLAVDIDDITHGGTLLRVRDAEGRELVARQLVHERDFVEVTLPAERCVIVVDRLVNLLVGDDHAVLHVQRANGFVPDRIGQLLRAVGAATATFVREGQDYEAAAAKQFLVAKLSAHRGPPVTVDEFIDKLASTSSQTGKPYEVRLPDGTTVTMREWLRGELAKIEAKAAR